MTKELETVVEFAREAEIDYAFGLPGDAEIFGPCVGLGVWGEAITVLVNAPVSPADDPVDGLVSYRFPLAVVQISGDLQCDFLLGHVLPRFL